MMPELLFWSTISYFVAIQAFFEWLYLRQAPTVPVTVLWRELAATQYGAFAYPPRKEAVRYFVRLRLDPECSDGRVVQIEVDSTFYGAVEHEDSFGLQAMPYRPR